MAEPHAREVALALIAEVAKDPPRESKWIKSPRLVDEALHNPSLPQQEIIALGCQCGNHLLDTPDVPTSSDLARKFARERGWPSDTMWKFYAEAARQTA